MLLSRSHALRRVCPPRIDPTHSGIGTGRGVEPRNGGNNGWHGNGDLPRPVGWIAIELEHCATFSNTIRMIELQQTHSDTPFWGQWLDLDAA